MTNLQPYFKSSNALLLLGILLIAANLRSPMTGIAPLFTQIKLHFALSDSVVGLLTSVPLFVLAVISPLCARLAQRFGLEKIIFLGILAITVGILLRSWGSLFWLYAGTAIIGIGIAFGNVLIPALIKRDFPQNIPLITSAYALAMGIAAALISALVVPLSTWLAGGWQWSLASAGLLAFLALLVWLPQIKSTTTPVTANNNQTLNKPIWRYPLAWQVSLFLACNSCAYYSMISWLPSILKSYGYDDTTAGQFHGLMQLASAFAGFLQVFLLHYMKDQRLLAVLTTLLAGLALIGLWAMPQYALIWSCLFGFGNGATFILALAFFGMRTHNAIQAAALSGMAQGITYLLAGIAPWFMGLLYENFSSWHSVIFACFVLNAAIAAFGLFAGRSIKL